MESRPFFRIIRKHQVRKILPIRMNLSIILNSPFSNLIKTPLLFKILIGLKLNNIVLQHFEKGLYQRAFHIESCLLPKHHIFKNNFTHIYLDRLLGQHIMVFPFAQWRKYSLFIELVQNRLFLYLDSIQLQYYLVLSPDAFCL